MQQGVPCRILTLGISMGKYLGIIRISPVVVLVEISRLSEPIKRLRPRKRRLYLSSFFDRVRAAIPTGEPFHVPVEFPNRKAYMYNAKREKNGK